MISRSDQTRDMLCILLDRLKGIIAKGELLRPDETLLLQMLLEPYIAPEEVTGRNSRLQ